MRFLTYLSRIITGVVFIFSGFVKAVDPMGSTYKFTDYFVAFGLTFLEPLALPLALVLSALEFLIGVSMLTGIRFRPAAWVLLFFMSFFTILTLLLALTNPVTDCGCFGDAIILTNWQTFFKNLILLPFVLLVFINRNQTTLVYSSITEWIILACFAALAIFFQVSSLHHLPVLDFMPYSVGTHIPDKMVVPDGAPQDVYRTFLYYEKDGETREFDEENYPWQDTTWKFVESKHILISKGYEPPIHDFTIAGRDGYDISEQILNDPGYSFIMVSYDLNRVNKEALLEANNLAIWCQANDCSFYCLTSSSWNEIEESVSSAGLQYNFFTTDEITLKTIIRSNPGLLLLKEGTIIGKWNFRDFPTPDNLGIQPLSFSLDALRKKGERNVVFFTITFLLLLVSYTRLLVPGMKGIKTNSN